jgi:hypothetical protein
MPVGRSLGVLGKITLQGCELRRCRPTRERARLAEVQVTVRPPHRGYLQTHQQPLHLRSLCRAQRHRRIRTSVAGPGCPACRTQWRYRRLPITRSSSHGVFGWPWKPRGGSSSGNGISPRPRLAVGCLMWRWCWLLRLMACSFASRYLGRTKTKRQSGFRTRTPEAASRILNADRAFDTSRTLEVGRAPRASLGAARGFGCGGCH